jgi:hypothetical protein
MEALNWEAAETEGEQGHQAMDLEMTTSGKQSRGIGCVLDFIEENPIGVTIFPASLLPPLHADDGGARSGGGGGCVLLDLKAYIADFTNETTAKDFTSAGHEMQATLRVACPPRVSHLCIHCPTLKPADFGTEPVILAACDGFLLFRAAICNSYHCDEPTLQDYFVYRAPLSRMHGRPSLTRLPRPDLSSCFVRCNVGLLRYDGGDSGSNNDDDGGSLALRSHYIPQHHYVVAGLRASQGGRGDFTRYDLHRFDSRDGKWTTEVLQLGPMAPSPGLTFFYHMTHKVVTLGGGVMGWVDLCRGILLCDVLADRPQLYYTPLPEPGKHELLSEASANVFRDIAVVQGGHIRCVEHQTQVRPGSHSNGTYISDNWTLTTWSWKVTNPSCSTLPLEGRWERDCKIDASHISGSLPKLLGQAASLPPLQQLHTGHPTLSLDDDDVVYVVAKVDHRDDKAFVLAVNMWNGALQAADYFGAERMIGISFTYTQYRPSDYAEITTGNPPLFKHITVLSSFVIDKFIYFDLGRQGHDMGLFVGCRLNGEA